MNQSGDYMDKVTQMYRSSDLADAEHALRFIDPGCCREDWVAIGMALKSAHGEAGFIVFDAWSQDSDKYKAEDTKSTWRSISGAGKITIATLFGRAKEGGYKPRKDGDYTPYKASVRPPITIPEESPEEALVKRETAQKYWAESMPDVPHEYATGKGFTEHGLRVNGKYLVVPAYNTDGQIQSAQRISTDGKYNLKGCSIKRTYYPIKGDKSTVYVVEGWATGMSVNAATGNAIAIAFGKANLKHVAMMMRDKFPDTRVIVAADTDHVGIAAEAALAVDGYYVVPDVTVGSDFNDMHLSKGLLAVTSQLKKDPQQPEPPKKIPPFPLDALGVVLADAASAIANMVQAPHHLAGQSILAATALAVQSRANVEIDNRLHPLSTFNLSIGLSGERKSGCDKYALEPHRAWERDQLKIAKEEAELYRNELDVWKADRAKAIKKGGLAGFRPEPAKPPTGEFISEEPTLEGLHRSFRYGQPTQGLFSDEGGQFFGGHAMNMDNALKTMAGLSKLWDGAAIRRTRGGDGESWTGYGRRLSAHLMVQPVVAGTVLNDALMQEQGILARFLIAKGEHLFGQRVYQTPRPEDKAAIARYNRCITELLEKPYAVDDEGGLILEIIRPTSEAMNLWIAAYNAIEAELADGGDYESIRAAASKSAENIARIAGVMAVFNNQRDIDLSTMQNAVQLGDYYLEQYKWNTRTARSYLADDQTNKLITWLKSLGKRTVDIDSISKRAPTNTGCRNSVDRSRSMMHRLAETGAVMCTALNNKNLPSEWDIM